MTKVSKRASIKQSLPRFEHLDAYRAKLEQLRQKYVDGATAALLEQFKSLKNEKWQLEAQVKNLNEELEALQLEIIGRMDQLGQLRLDVPSGGLVLQMPKVYPMLEDEASFLKWLKRHHPTRSSRILGPLCKGSSPICWKREKSTRQE